MQRAKCLSLELELLSLHLAQECPDRVLQELLRHDIPLVHSPSDLLH